MVPPALRGPISGSWWAWWMAVTLAAAGAATLLDAFLLQERRSYFTGGFLSVDHLTTPAATAAFVGTSLAVDACAVFPLVAAGFWLTRRLRVAVPVAAMGVFAVALTPIVVADFIAYELLTYLGDAFDLRLMFDLAGGSPSELLAVSSAHLQRLAWVAVSACLIGGITTWLVRRHVARSPHNAAFSSPVGWRPMLVSAVLVVSGATVTAIVRNSSDVMDNGLRRKPTGQFFGALVNVVTDLDGDGFGVLGRPPDPALFDGRVHPYARDVPGNGIDENGVGGDLPEETAPYAEPGWRHADWPTKPDVVLFVLESFRADTVGATLDGRPVTPTLDALAAQGAAVREAYSHNGYTVQSREHLLLGHVAGANRETTLIDDFKAQGYQTAFFSAQDESFGGSGASLGYDRADVAYDARADRDRRYTTFTTAGSLAVSHAVLNARVAEFLDRRTRERPLFLYVNYHDTHFPYHHRDIAPIVSKTLLPQAQIVPARADALREMYLNTAANVDRAIGDLLGRITADTGREPGIIVISDHGESLFDEGFLGHGYALNDAQTKIPLVVANLPMVIEEPFGQAELRRTLNEALASGVGADARPMVRRADSKRVFQYLGTLPRSREIAFNSPGGRLVFDLRTRQARIFDRAWRREAELNDEERRLVKELVHTWERMNLADDAAAARTR
ncbi:MAG: sulfatase-like hydrolase/transferase [Acidobacteriota bacterium]